MEQGYKTSFHYGGDVDFANMRSYLVNGEFSRIVTESSFPASDRSGNGVFLIICLSPVFLTISRQIRENGSMLCFPSATMNRLKFLSVRNSGIRISSENSTVLPIMLTAVWEILCGG